MTVPLSLQHTAAPAGLRRVLVVLCATLGSVPRTAGDIARDVP
ncbi:hypothetical protein ACFFTK_03585 [Pseudonocardia petroleophila]|nr:hypothetical protein [Pseudonocardia petroleophila]